MYIYIKLYRYVTAQYLAAQRSKNFVVRWYAVLIFLIPKWLGTNASDYTFNLTTCVYYYIASTCVRLSFNLIAL